MKRPRWCELNDYEALETRENRTEEGDEILDAFADAARAGDDMGPFAEWFDPAIAALKRLEWALAGKSTREEKTT